MKQFQKQIYLKIANDGAEDYMLVYDQMPLPAPGEPIKVGRYRLEEISYPSKQEGGLGLTGCLHPLRRPQKRGRRTSFVVGRSGSSITQFVRRRKV
jgi:hypothetical protein